jgi:hypothetical protein
MIVHLLYQSIMLVNATPTGTKLLTPRMMIGSYFPLSHLINQRLMIKWSAIVNL